MSTLLQFIKDVKLDFTQAFFSESSDQELNYTNFEIAPKPVKEIVFQGTYKYIKQF